MCVLESRQRQVGGGSVNLFFNNFFFFEGGGGSSMWLHLEPIWYAPVFLVKVEEYRFFSQFYTEWRLALSLKILL